MSQASIENAHAPQDGVPRQILRGAAMLVGFALLAAAASRLTDVGTLHMPAATAVDTLALRFEDRTDGSVAVRDAQGDRIIYSVQPGAYGFIRSTLRGLARERRRADLDASTPFTLTRWSDGTVSLQDVSTGRRVNLDAFGPDNANAFAQLFAMRDARP
jgi:putative photosynthetic complex assembly protein